MYSEILTYVRKLGTLKKLLKQAILRKFFLYFGNIFRNKNSEEIDLCSEIKIKFKGTLKKLLKQAMLRKFFLYFGNIFRNNCVI